MQKYIGFVRVRYQPATLTKYVLCVDARFTTYEKKPNGTFAADHAYVKVETDVVLDYPIGPAQRDTLFAKELSMLDILRTRLIDHGFSAAEVTGAIGTVNVFRPFHMPEVSTL